MPSWVDNFASLSDGTYELDYPNGYSDATPPYVSYLYNIVSHQAKKVSSFGNVSLTSLNGAGSNQLVVKGSVVFGSVNTRRVVVVVGDDGEFSSDSFAGTPWRQITIQKTLVNYRFNNQVDSGGIQVNNNVNLDTPFNDGDQCDYEIDFSPSGVTVKIAGQSDIVIPTPAGTGSWTDLTNARGMIEWFFDSAGSLNFNLSATVSDGLATITAGAASFSAVEFVPPPSPITTAQGKFLGCARRIATSGTVQLAATTYRVARVIELTHATRLVLPVATNIPLGGPIHIIINNTGGTLPVGAQPSPGTDLFTIPNGESLIVCRTPSGWIGIPKGGS